MRINAKSVLAALAAISLMAHADLTDGFARTVKISAGEGLVTNGVTLANFPVLVRLGSHISGFSYSDFDSQLGGADLLFTDEDETVSYPHEVQLWDPSGVSLVWVKIPSLTSTTRFSMWYGKDSAAANAASSVWSEYKSVLHLDEDASTFTCADSTANGFDATARSGTLGSTADGKIGGYRNNWYTKSNDPTGIVFPTMQTLGTGANFTFSTWLRRGTDSYVAWDHILMCCTSFEDCVANGGLLVMMPNGDNRLAMTGKDGNWNYATFEWDPVFTMGSAWDHFTITFDGSQCTYYVNGVLRRSGQITGTVTERGDPLVVGALSSDTGANPWRGDFDEVRLRAGSSSPEWVNAEYETMNSLASLLYGPASQPGALVVGIRTAHAVRNADGTVSVSATLTSDSDADLYAVFNGSLRLSIGRASADASITNTFAESSFGATAATWDCTVVAEAVSDSSVTASQACEGTFMTGGEVAVSAVEASAYEDGLVAGSVVITRPASATQKPLDVTLDLSGTAVRGETYSMDTSFTFAAGVSQIAVPVTPIVNHSVNEDVTVSVLPAAGQYARSSVPAVVTIVDDRYSERPPVVLRAFAVNGHLNVWVEDFTGTKADYVLQRQSRTTGEWETYDKIEVGSNDTYTDHPFSPCLYSPDPSQSGITKWRIGEVAKPGLWTEFTVDARFPLKGTPISSGNSQLDVYPYDGKTDSYYLSNASWWSMWTGLDLGEEKTVRQIAWVPNGGTAAYLECADNPQFENSTRFYTLTADDLVRDRLHVYTLPTPVTARYFRIESGYDGWFSMWEVEFSEGIQTVHEDLATGYPTVRFTFNPESATEIYSAGRENGAYSLVATVPAGTNSWTDTALQVGETRWYRVNGCKARGVRIRRLERDPADEATLKDCTLFSSCDKPFLEEYGNGPEKAFDGNTATTPSAGPIEGGSAEEYGNPALGVVFAERKAAFVNKCRVYCHDNPWWLYQRLNGVVIYGSNDDSDPVGNAVEIGRFASDLAAIGGFYREWMDIPCDSSACYKYVFLRLPDGVRDGDPWRGNASEIQFYGWSEKDVARPGLTVIVR